MFVTGRAPRRARALLAFVPVIFVAMQARAFFADARVAAPEAGAIVRDDGIYPVQLQVPERPRPPAERARPTPRPRGPGPRYAPAPGRPVFRIAIPKIELDEVVRQGAEQAQLARGPGHYPSCGRYFTLPYCSLYEEVWPGERGRVIVAGHRTLAGADFIRLGRLRRGDAIHIRARWGSFVYIVTRTAIVDDQDASTIVPGGPRRELMLVTCHPKFSSAQRLLVFATLRR